MKINTKFYFFVLVSPSISNININIAIINSYLKFPKKTGIKPELKINKLLKSSI